MAHPFAPFAEGGRHPVKTVAGQRRKFPQSSSDGYSPGFAARSVASHPCKERKDGAPSVGWRKRKPGMVGRPSFLIARQEPKPSPTESQPSQSVCNQKRLPDY